MCSMMKARDYFVVDLVCCLDVDCYIGKCLMDNFKRISSSLYWKQALEACHENMGHLSIERTTALLKDCFYWPSITEDVEKHIKSCP